MKKDLNEFKQKLIDEKGVLINELKEVGVMKNVRNPDDWQGKPMDIDIDRADSNEVADRIESYEANSALVNDLEGRLTDIDTALANIENNTYGMCEVCQKPIEEDRLEANPAAKTCKQHMNA